MRGFTIVELLIVIVVIGVLASIAIIAYSGIQSRARDTKRQNDVASIVKALEAYHAINGRYPATGGASFSVVWSSSLDASWQTLATSMASAGVTSLPVESNPSTSVASFATGRSYDLYVNAAGWCGAAPGQMYILIYRLDGTQATVNDGDCTTNPFPAYSGRSTYRKVR